MKKNFIETSAIIACVAGTGEGEAVYSNRTSEICGLVDSENIFTPLADIKEMVIDFIEETEGSKTINLTPAYTDLGAFKGFIIEYSNEKGE